MPEIRDAEWERQHLYRLFFDEPGGLGICGCNQPHAAYDLVRALLVYFEQDHADRDWRDLGRMIGTDGAVHLVLCLLDNAGVIEHGGTVAGAWLTDKGRAALEMMRRHEWESVDETGYPHDGRGCTPPCWVPREPAPPMPSGAELRAKVAQAAAEARARMTPHQRAVSDAMADLMLYGEARIGVESGRFVAPCSGLYHFRTGADPHLLAECTDACGAFGGPFVAEPGEIRTVTFETYPAPGGPNGDDDGG